MATNRHRHFCFSCFSSSAEAGSSQNDDFAASSSNQTQPGLRKIIQNEDIVKVEGKCVVDTHKLIQHISELLELREKEKLRHEQPSKVSGFFKWPSVPGFNKLKEILSGTDIKKLVDLVKSGLDSVSDLKDIISGPVKTVLTDIGTASVATAGLLLVAYTLEGLDNLSFNQKECWSILEQMIFVAIVVERLKASPGVIQDLIERATILIAEGAIMCCSKMDSSPWRNFFSTQKIKQDLSDITKRLNVMYMQINTEIGFRVLTAIESKGRSPLSQKYPTHAVGIEEPIEEVLRLLKIESDDQNAVTVILHGFGGMGKTTLADAVFSKVGGCKYSKVRLPVDINPPDVIVKLQREILTDLLETGQSMPNFRAYEDGRRELEAVLQNVHAFIYIDNILDPTALEMLLPEDLTEAKKVRILLTTRDKDVKITCPRPCTEPKIYTMKGIQHQEALIILKREIKEGEGITEVQLNNIIDKCGGIPLMLKVTAAMIGRAGQKGKDYASLMEEKQKAYARLIENKKWTDKAFDGMGYAFAYNALPRECKDPFLDICKYFNDKWKWDKVEDIVGQDELETLENRALISRTPDGFASVHDVILTLARQMSKEESKDKELRCKFTNASELKEFLEKGDTEGIRGIWLTERNDVPKEEDDDDRKVVVQASALDKFHKSLRFLQLGNSIKVEGNCKEIFTELVFFGAKISQLPFDDVSQQLKQLRYLSCTAHTLMPSPLPSKLRFMDFDGMMFREVPKATIYNDEVAPIQSASTSD